MPCLILTNYFEKQDQIRLGTIKKFQVKQWGGNSHAWIKGSFRLPSAWYMFDFRRHAGPGKPQPIAGLPHHRDRPDAQDRSPGPGEACPTLQEPRKDQA